MTHFVTALCCAHNDISLYFACSFTSARQVAVACFTAALIFAEKQSGINTDRAALARCLRCLAPGDVLLVTKLDRLARSTRDLLNTLA